jgi:hypothetical protein
MRTGISGGLALALTFALLLSACGSPFVDMLTPRSPHPHPAIVQELDQNVATWAAAGITRYSFTYQPSCFCFNAPHLIVADGGAVRIDGVAVDPSQPLHDWTPAGVPGLFALVRQAAEGDEVKVTYDPVTGVPVSMESDPMANAYDDELSFTVAGWTLDPPDDTLLGKVTAARTIWDRQQLARYTMTIRITCVGCAEHLRTYEIAVHDGNPVVSSDGRRIDPDDLEGIPVRVEALFESATFVATMPGTTIDFDPLRGYPTRITTSPDPTGEATSGTTEVLRFTVP